MTNVAGKMKESRLNSLDVLNNNGVVEKIGMK